MGDGEGPEGRLESLAAGQAVLSGAMEGPCEEVRGRQVICVADVRGRWDRLRMKEGVTRVSSRMRLPSGPSGRRWEESRGLESRLRCIGRP